MAKAGFTMQEVMDTVMVKNRVTDGQVFLIHDREPWVWAPGEVKALARTAANWFVRKSMFLFSPGDQTRNIPAKSHHKLVVLGIGKDESNLTDEETRVPELIDRRDRPTIDLQTGKVMRTVYIDPSSVAGAQQVESLADMTKKMTKDHISERIMDTTVSAVKEIADALPKEIIGDNVQVGE